MCFLSLHGVRVGLVVYDADKDPLLIYLGSNPLSGIHFKIIFYCFIVFLTYENIGLDIGIEYPHYEKQFFLTKIPYLPKCPIVPQPILSTFYLESSVQDTPRIFEQISRPLRKAIDAQ